MAGGAFIWGSGGQRLTPEQIARQREYAQRQMLEGADYSPIGHWSQGLSRVAQGLLGAMSERRAAEAEDANAAESRRIAQALLEGGAAPGLGGGLVQGSTAIAQQPDALDVLNGASPAGIVAPAADTAGTTDVANALAASSGAPAAPPQGPQVSPAVIEALTSPYADPQTKQLAMAMYERQTQLTKPLEIIKAGDGALYDPNTGQWITAPGYGEKEVKAPETQIFYDNLGREYRAQWDPATREWVRVGGAKAPSGMILRTNPDGSVELVQGSSLMSRPLTETQSKDTTYATRAQGALPTLDAYDSYLANSIDRLADKDPTGLVRGRVQREEYQLARQAGDEFLQAILRKDTGAAITEAEQELYGATYLPRPGDSPALIEQKRQSRRRALEALKAGMPPEAIVQQELALRRTRPVGAAAPQPARERPSQPRRNVSVRDMTDEELEAIANGNR